MDNEMLGGVLINLNNNIGRLIELTKENNELLKTVDWKLWEIYKITYSFSDANKIEIKEPFEVDTQDN